MKVALFVPCFIDAFFPEVGIATLELLERLGIEVDYSLNQTCCGQPLANSGEQADAAPVEALFVENFESMAKADGVQVHWALDAEEHNRIVYEILSSHAVRTLVKSKSMLTEECEMRPYLERRGIEVIETDLGEHIQQLDNEPPGHIVVPAVHKLRADVAKRIERQSRRIHAPYRK